MELYFIRKWCRKGIDLGFVPSKDSDHDQYVHLPSLIRVSCYALNGELRPLASFMPTVKTDLDWVDAHADRSLPW